MKMIHRLLGVLLGFGIFIMLLYAALVPSAMNRTFYAEQFVVNDSFGTANVSEAELNRVIDHVLKYLWNEEEDMQLTITYLDNSTGEAFDEREIAHMVDVKNLFSSGRNLNLICQITSLAIAIYFIIIRRKLEFKVVNSVRNTLFAILALLAVIGLYALANFNQAFTLFHEIFFTNDLWLLDYNDLLIIMLPESLFATIAFQTLLSFFVYLVLVLLGLRQIKKALLQQSFR